MPRWFPSHRPKKHHTATTSPTMRDLETDKKDVEDTRAQVRREHMKLVRFEDVNGRETFVNPERVNHISDYGSGTTEINFGDKQASVFVSKEVSAVATTLLKAATHT
jgi:hypothetical protein